MDIYFEIKSFSGKIIRTTCNHWELITKVKHPEIEGKESEVKKCLTSPVEIRRSSEDPDVYLYYLPRGKYYICVVVRYLNGDGFVITSYKTNKIKEGGVIWRK